MTSRAHWKLFVSALLLSGCQSTGSIMPWFASREPVYTSEELAALDNPRPAAARPELASTVATSASGDSRIRTVSATRTGPPVAAGKVDELIRFGQAAIREAGQNDPGKLNQARDLFSQALALDGTSASAHHGMAIVADLQQDWATAEMHYKQALRTRTQDPSLLNDIGYSYLLQNRYHEASQYLNQALQFSPQHERAHINLALLSLKHGDRAGAQARLSSIYSAADTQTTLARLERDLQSTGAAQPGTAVATSYAPVNGSPQQWAEQERFRAATTQPQGSLNAPALTQYERPIHVYPPGVVASDPPEIAANQQFTGANGSGYPQPQNPSMANMGANGYPGQNMQHSTYTDANGFANPATQYNPNGNGQLNIPSTVNQQNQYGTVQYTNSPSGYGPPVHSGTPSQNVPQQGLLQQMNPQQQSMNHSPWSAAAPAAGVNNFAVAGMNAGPGALFPIGTQAIQGQSFHAPTPQPNVTSGAAQTYPANSAGQSFHPAMNAPAMRNDSMSPAPANGLPSEQQMQTRNAPPQNQYGAPSNYPTNYQNNYPSNINTASSSQYVTPFGPGGTVNVPTTGNGAQPGYGQQGQGYGQSGQTSVQTPQTSTYPATSQGTPINRQPQMMSSPGNNSPLSAYERQLQSLDNQYNRALQQMDGTGTALNPPPGQYR